MDALKKIAILTAVFFVIAIVFFLFLKEGLFYITIAIFFGLAFFLFFRNEPLKLVMLFVFLLPYGGTAPFAYKFMNLTGAKLLNILAVGLILVTLINFLRWRPIPMVVVFFAVIVPVALGWNVYRALPDAGKLSLIFFEDMSKQKLILSFFLQPMVAFVPFFLMPLFVKTKKDMRIVVKFLVWTFCFFIMVVFLYWLFFIPNKSALVSVRREIKYLFSMIANFLVRIIIFGLPLIMARYFVTKNKIYIFFLTLGYTCVSLLFSRMGYLLGIFSLFYYFIASGRKKYLWVIAVGLIFIIVLLPGFIMDRATVGFDQGTTNAISGNRIDMIWKPVLAEHFDDISKFLIGNGFMSFVRSEVMRENLVYGVVIAHNMYIDLFLDDGIVFLLLYLSVWLFAILGIRKSIQNAVDEEFREYQIAFYITIICYLLGGTSEGSLLPTKYNSLAWVIFAAAIVNRRLLNEDLHEETVD